MEFHLTEQRKKYFESRGKIIVNACPGSGKTTCIVYKLATLEKECLEKYGPHAGIACLSFTNVAKDEILTKYKKIYHQELGYPHIVSTIDSFVNQYITLPFYNLLNKDFTRPKIVDEESIIDNIFKLKYKDKGVWKEGVIKSLQKFKTKAGFGLFRSYPPSSIWIDVNGRFTFQGKIPDPANVDDATFQEYGKTVFTTKAIKGLITSLDSAYMAFHLLKSYDRIGEWLVKRFPFLIIDEAQDNSEIQHTIFDKLISTGLTNIEMIGDPYQSLYEWRDAKPQLFLKKYSDSTWTGIPLSQNRRSVQRIIDCFSIVRNPNDEVITSIDVQDLEVPIFVYKYTAANPAQIVRHFEEKCAVQQFKNAHIVVRGNTLKDQMLGNTAAIDPWKTHFPSRLLRVRHHFESNETKSAVDELRKLILELQNPGLHYSDLYDLRSEKRNDHKYNGKLYSFLYKIPATTLSFSDWTANALLQLKTEFDIDASSLFEFKVKINGYKMVTLKNQNVNLFFNKAASSQYNIPITTIHQVKGSTLDAILYFFDETSIGQSVSFNDFKQSVSFPTEKQRMIYVACSRPKQLLALAFPNKITDHDLKGKFGENIEIVTL